MSYNGDEIHYLPSHMNDNQFLFEIENLKFENCHVEGFQTIQDGKQAFKFN
uniref:Uncharacterized protein n=1 Tax=viral metagenome TaxID=1070528 RepID=A0A6C0BJS2_9ZZZZ